MKTHYISKSHLLTCMILLIGPAPLLSCFAQTPVKAWSVSFPPYLHTNAFLIPAGPNVLYVDGNWDGTWAFLYGPNGNTLWSTNIMSTAHLVGGVDVDSTGNPYISVLDQTASGTQWKTVKLSAPNGAVLWSADFGGYLSLDSSGNAFVSYYGQGTSKLAASDGSLLWGTLIGGQVAVDSNGNAYVSGFEPVSPSSDMAETVKLDATTGSQDWLTAAPYAGSLALNGAGDVYLNPYPSNNGQNELVKLSTTDGSQLWTTSPNLQYSSLGPVVDSNGNAYLSGEDMSGNPVTTKFDGANGTPLWSSPNSGRMALDSVGDLYLGESTAIVKLSGVDGSQLWSIPTQSDPFLPLAVDSAGNVYALSLSTSSLILTKYINTGITSLNPDTALAGSTGFTLTVNGFGFASGSVVQWNGATLPTTYVSASQLTAQVPSSDLTTSSSFVSIPVAVQFPNGSVTSPKMFVITNNTVTAVQSTTVESGNTATVSTAPTTSGTSGVTAVASGNPTTLTVTAVNYSSNPTSGTYFDTGGGYVDLQVTGADSSDAVTAYFYYPSTISGSAEANLELTYYTGSGWAPVLSSGGVPPVKDTTDNLDGTVSGGRFTVTFDNTSTPPITGLTGTVFGAADSTRPLLNQIVASTRLIPVGTPLNLDIQFSAAGALSAQRIEVSWGDGTTEDLVPSEVGDITATHSYEHVGKYSVMVTLWDENNNETSSTFGPVFVYAPGVGSLTGGGWFRSAAGDDAGNPALASKATFACNAHYVGQGATLRGQLEFQLHQANLDFHSSSFQLLAVTANRAWLEGTGTINRKGSYGFLLSARAGRESGHSSPAIRIEIWDIQSRAVVYDNQPGASETAYLQVPLGEGSLQIRGLPEEPTGESDRNGRPDRHE